MSRQSGEARRKTQVARHRETSLEDTVGDKMGDKRGSHSGRQSWRRTGDTVGREKSWMVDQVPRLEPCAYMGREGEVAIPYPCF